MNHLQHLIANHAHPDELAAWLDRLSHAARLDEVMALQRNDQRALFQRVQGAHPLDLQHYVPASTPDLHEVIHWGRNTLPAFNFFQKRFCRPPAAQVQHQPVLWGYNEQTMKALTGPGYFHARPGDQDTPVWIDYRGLPPAGGAPGWPRPLNNRQRLSRVIYYGTVDRMRRVSEHVSIGAAFRGERALSAWFILCRQP
jgi:hypothetical protein